MREFELIRRLQERIRVPGGAHAGAVRIGIGDDAAVLDCPPGRQLVVCTDSLVGGVHFPDDTAPAAIGHKALAVNLSDLAAMGAEPAWFFLSLTLPSADPDWLDEFAAGMAALARDSGIVLAGGDLTSGPLNVCVTALGLVEPGRALTRSGAKPGELVVLSGRTGAAARALSALQSGEEPTPAEREALDYPSPQLALGRALRGLATACIDLSDGLLADLGHVLDMSGVGAEINLADLPSMGRLAAMPDRERWALQVAGGDDYELCFTMPAGDRERLGSVQQAGGVELTVIGVITEAGGLVLREPGGAAYRPARAGYEHFGAAGSLP